MENQEHYQGLRLTETIPQTCLYHILFFHIFTQYPWKLTVSICLSLQRSKSIKKSTKVYTSTSWSCIILNSELGLPVCYLVFSRKKKNKKISSLPWPKLKLTNVLIDRVNPGGLGWVTDTKNTEKKIVITRIFYKGQCLGLRTTISKFPLVLSCEKQILSLNVKVC